MIHQLIPGDRTQFFRIEADGVLAEPRLQIGDAAAPDDAVSQIVDQRQIEGVTVLVMNYHRLDTELLIAEPFDQFLDAFGAEELGALVFIDRLVMERQRLGIDHADLGGLIGHVAGEEVLLQGPDYQRTEHVGCLVQGSPDFRDLQIVRVSR